MASPIDDLDFLQEILELPEKEARTPRTRKPKDVRDHDNWFRLEHNISGTCSQGEDCLGRIYYGKGPGRVTAIVNGIEMCRIDFLEGLGYNGGEVS